MKHFNFHSLLLFLYFSENAVTQAQKCPSMSNVNRNFIVETINAKRSAIAKGLVPMTDGNFVPQGKNIRKLRYYLDLEASAKKIAELGQDGYYSDIWSDKLLFSSVPNNLTNVIQNFIATIFPPKITGNYVTYNGSQFFNTNIPWAQDNLIYIGCLLNCNLSSVWNAKAGFFCVTGPLRILDQNPYSYALGNPCVEHNDCTKFGFRKCDANFGLCLPALYF